ncbi:hypothetical protein HJFPF1_01329 [Paramyrothecium foliicola]|nr:hypothetical protein HJFPF1_01329 [Paramyrothecium foliicola]
MALTAPNTTSWFGTPSLPFLPPGVSFCERPKLELRKSQRSIPRLSSSPGPICHDELEWLPQPSSRFLSLPLEIRMNIYGFVHQMNPPPASKPTSSPYPMPTPRRCFFKQVRGDGGSTRTPPAAPQDLLRPDRPTSGLPTALLLVCKQVYDEARLIPLRNNEFTFVNWFSSGLWSAHFFLQGLKPWQWQEVRYARLELLAAELGDLSDSSDSLRRWSGLCDKWAHGLRGLRLRIVGGRGLGIMPVKPIVPIINRPRDGTETEREDKRIRELFADDVARCAWVTMGLTKLWALQRLELDLVLPRWSAGQKLAWCRKLEDVLRENGMRTTVVCAERVTQGEWEAASQPDAAQ